MGVVEHFQHVDFHFFFFLCANARKGQNCLRTTKASTGFSVELAQRHSRWFLVLLSNLNGLYEIRFNNLCSPIITGMLGLNDILKGTFKTLNSLRKSRLQRAIFF